jgi:hypothetical protein
LPLRAPKSNAAAASWWRAATAIPFSWRQRERRSFIRCAPVRSGRFARIADDLRLYRAIATMNRKAPLPSLTRQKPTFAKAAALARKWQLRQLASRLEEMAKSELTRR